jgi:hypothetical protein
LWYGRNKKNTNRNPRGKFLLGEVEIGCAVLDDGTRIITESGLKNFIDAMGSGKLTENQIKEFTDDFSKFNFVEVT